VPHFLDSSNLIKNMTLSVSPELDITVKKLTKITKTLYLKRKKKKKSKINKNYYKFQSPYKSNKNLI
jgi:hypothetical protein